MTSRPAARHEDDREWRVRGQPLDDRHARALTEGLSRARAALGQPAPPRLYAYADAERALKESAQRAVSLLREPAADRDGASKPVTEALLSIVELERELGEARLAARSAAVTRVQEALGRLRTIDSVATMMERLPVEVCRCGFSRAFVSRVQDGVWIPEAVHVEGDSKWAARILAAGRKRRQRLNQLVLETRMVRDQAPLLVPDTSAEPRVHQPITLESRSQSYVAAPIMPHGEVIGFLHADCYMERRHVDEFDRDVLWMFAEGAGYAFERTALVERMRDARSRVADLAGGLTAAMEDLVSAEVEMSDLEHDAQQANRAAMSALVASGSQVHRLLTRRELEIASMLAQGLTNSQIAGELVLSVATVKTHVRNVLRKLRAANRVEAATRFRELAGRGWSERLPER